MSAAADVVREFHLVQGGFYAGGDAEPMLALVADDVVWRVPGRSLIAGEHRGRDGVRRYFEERRRLANATLRVEVRTVLSEGDVVLQLAEGTVERGGREWSWSTVGIFRVRDERIVECSLVPFDLYAFDEIWS